MTSGLSQRNRLLLALAFVLAAALLALALNEYARVRLSGTGGGNLPVSSGAAAVGAPFELTDGTGQRVSDRDFRGRSMMVVFLDPSDEIRATSALQVAGAAVAGLGDAARRIAPVVISLDTSATAKASLGQLLANQGSVAWSGLTGGEAEIAALARSYFVPRDTGDGSRRGAPPVGPPTVYLMDEQGAFVAHMILPVDPLRLTEWLQQKL